MVADFSVLNTGPREASITHREQFSAPESTRAQPIFSPWRSAVSMTASRPAASAWRARRDPSCPAIVTVALDLPRVTWSSVLIVTGLRERWVFSCSMSARIVSMALGL